MMSSNVISLNELLEQSRQKLIKPFARTRRRLLFILNLSYLALTPIFLLSEKLATGHFVPHSALGVIYGLVGITNLISACHNYLELFHKKEYRLIPASAHTQVNRIVRWASVLSIMAMSVCHMLGLGNPSSDALMTDFALGHSLIVLAAILLGRRAAIVWSILVVVLLIYATVDKGYSYQFNFLTPAESVQYEKALQRQEPWAVVRQDTLRTSHLNPPRVSRYFNTWFVFILIAFLSAYFFAGITLDMFKVIPAVAEEIKDAIDATKNHELEQGREKARLEEQNKHLAERQLQFLQQQVNPHFLFKALNNIYGMISVGTPEAVDRAGLTVASLSDMLRYTLYYANEKTVDLEREIQFIRDYVAMEQIRHVDQTLIQLSVEGTANRCVIPPLLFITLVENAFKHGLSADFDNKWVRIRIVIDSATQQVAVDVENSRSVYAGQAPQSAISSVKTSGFGLANIRERLAIAYQPSQYTLTITETPETYHVSLRINNQAI
jgi:two-component system LytT family sensor kinase